MTAFGHLKVIILCPVSKAKLISELEPIVCRGSEVASRKDHVETIARIHIMDTLVLN